MDGYFSMQRKLKDELDDKAAIRELRGVIDLFADDEEIKTVLDVRHKLKTLGLNRYYERAPVILSQINPEYAETMINEMLTAEDVQIAKYLFLAMWTNNPRSSSKVSYCVNPRLLAMRLLQRVVDPEQPRYHFTPTTFRKTSYYRSTHRGWYRNACFFEITVSIVIYNSVQVRVST